MTRRMTRTVLSLVSAFMLMGLMSPREAVAASGTDGGFGYTWRDTVDGAARTSAVPDPFTTANPINNSAPIGPVSLGMTPGFPFYGVVYTQVWISDNGWISFFDPVGNSHPTGSAIPTAPGPRTILAPWWLDIDSSNTATALNYYGAVPSMGGFVASWGGTDTVNGVGVQIDCILFPDGRIKFQYQSAYPLGSCTIGIERDGAAEGIQIANGATIAPGVAITPQYTIEFLPPPILPTECAQVPVTACGSVNASLPGVLPGNIQYYSCSANRYDARERIYALTLTQATRLDLALTGGPNLRAFLLGSCNERQCLRGPFTNLRIPLGAGTYYIAVDGPAQADEGAFTLNITCAPLGQPLPCPGSVSGTTVGGSTFWASYGCAGALNFTGPEMIYSVTSATLTNLQASIAAAPAGLDVLVMQPDAGEITGADCIAWGDTQAIAWNAPPAEYLIVIDGVAAGSGTFNLTTACSVGLNCASVAGTVDVGASRVNTLSGDTTTGSSQVQTYSCDPPTVYAGNEDIWVVDLPNPGQLSVYPISGNVSYFILTDCNEGSCLGRAGCAMQLPAGQYYIVVDSPAGGEPYEGMLVFEEQFNRWSECEDPFGTTMLTDTTRNFWNLNDLAFCWDFPGPPTSKNYPDGCTFAMYATVRCGTALHLPFFDVEGGHVRVFDVFAGQYVDLTAISGGGWFMSGNEIIWQDADCESGSDDRWNETVTDVYFDRPEGLCGIYRLEFINHSGNVWELYANCLGDRTPLFNIHDSLCTALEDYQPLPNISLTSASATFVCPDITVTYTIKNDGCAGVTNFPVDLFDGGTLVATDVVASLAAGETQTLVFTATFAATPTTSVRIEADGNNVVTECTEVPASGCAAVAGTDLINLPGCSSTCQVIANAVSTPTATCVGAPVTIDGTSSSASLCPNNALEYQLRGPTGTVPWQSSPIFPGISPVNNADYDLDVRCRDLPSCLDSDRVNVPVERRPLLDPASVRATDNAACNLGIVITWDAATFYGATRTGAYNVYRADTDVDIDGDVDCDDALAAGPVVVGLPTAGYADSTTVAGGTYYYVIEAEDSTPNSRCLPAGPRNSGAATRVPANFGTCVAVVDNAAVRPDLLPRIGGTLRAGGDYGDGSARYGLTFVEFSWQVDRVLNAAQGEHYHLLRSAQPDTGFTPITDDATLLQSEGFTDYGAAHPNDGLPHVWYYLAYVADSCDNDNSAFDGGG